MLPVAHAGWTLLTHHPTLALDRRSPVMDGARDGHWPGAILHHATDPDGLGLATSQGCRERVVYWVLATSQLWHLRQHQHQRIHPLGTDAVGCAPVTDLPAVCRERCVQATRCERCYHRCQHHLLQQQGRLQQQHAHLHAGATQHEHVLVPQQQPGCPAQHTHTQRQRRRAISDNVNVSNPTSSVRTALSVRSSSSWRCSLGGTTPFRAMRPPSARSGACGCV